MNPFYLLSLKKIHGFFFGAISVVRELCAAMTRRPNKTAMFKALLKVNSDKISKSFPLRNKNKKLTFFPKKYTLKKKWRQTVGLNNTCRLHPRNIF